MTTALGKKNARPREVVNSKEGEQIVIAVDDDSPGIEPSMREAVMRRGIRADEAAQGSGLGLAIVRDLAENYHGSISLEDSPMGGARATNAAGSGCGLAPNTIYVHCHHGKHRGPTAAAVICMANNGWTPPQAEAWLAAAGTATNYIGLYETVRTFQVPTAENLRAVPSAFLESAKVSGLVEAMVDIDERWDHLKAVRAAGYQAPKQHPDINPANEALMLWERYREAQGLPESARHGTDFIERLKTAEIEARKVEQWLRLFTTEPKREIREHLDKTFDGMGHICASCHKAYRDSAGVKGWQ